MIGKGPILQDQEGTRRRKTLRRSSYRSSRTTIRSTSHKLKTRLVDKLDQLVRGRASQGVNTIYKESVVPKGEKFTQSLLRDLDYTSIDYTGWTTSDDLNQLIARPAA